MATSPYRVPAQSGPKCLRVESQRRLDLAGVAGFAWVITLVRVVAGFVQAEAPNRELDLAWLILLLLPVVIWKELKGPAGC